ncbi:hypothetical protein DTL42_18860 [Bremerella cremea]|uniref:Uncharacterized protein n=1 Tax=Bremerella cremea TaxID=1031537 RepID=A0A368KMA3_9BACT|nr:hypothetical protein [Bremerella cremea]RCS43220.1 hypothetical protein DTL42_18860 [Bremerella cremea]
MVDQRTVEVLLLGDLEAAEFSCLLPTLAKLANVRWQRSDETAALANFAWVLLCAARPGRFGEAEVESIRRRNPLAQIVQIHGPWCYGEARTWPLPAGIERIAWYEAPYRLPSLLQSTGGPPIPATSSPQERALALLSDVSRSAEGGEVGIYALTAADFGLLASACQALGMTATWAELDQPPDSSWVGMVAIVASTDRAEFPAIAEAFRHAGDIPKLLCVGAPTWEDWQKGHSCGVTAILGQPFSLADVAQLLIPQGDCGILPLVNRAGKR